MRTWEGWLYLAVVMDLYSRRIVGWSIQPTMAQDLVLDALLMALRRRKPTRALIQPDQVAAMPDIVSARRIILSRA